MPKTPLQTVKEKFKDKASLVAAVKSLMNDELSLDRLHSQKGLNSVANKKLLQLHATLTEVKSKYGSRAKLIDAIGTAQKRVKDADYKKSLERFPTKRLLELLQSAQKKTPKKSAK